MLSSSRPLSEEEVALFAAVREDDLHFLTTTDQTVLERLGQSVVDDMGKTLLHHAAERASLESLQVLLPSLKECINAQDTMGYTPMHWAAQRGKGDMIVALKRFGAQLDIASNYGETPLQVAKRYHRPKQVIEALQGIAAETKEDSKSVQEFLEKLGLGGLGYAERFEEEAVDLELLFSGVVSDLDLEKLGVTKLGHRKRILLEITRR